MGRSCSQEKKIMVPGERTVDQELTVGSHYWVAGLEKNHVSGELSGSGLKGQI